MRTDTYRRGGLSVKRQIVATGQRAGLASSQALKAAIASIAIAAAVLLIFFFLNSATKNRAAESSTGSQMSAPAPAAT